MRGRGRATCASRAESAMRSACGRAPAIRGMSLGCAAHPAVRQRSTCGRGYVCVHARQCAGAASHVRPVPRVCSRRTTGRPDTSVSALQTLHGMNLSCAMLRVCTWYEPVVRHAARVYCTAWDVRLHAFGWSSGGVLACMGCPPCWGSVWVPSFRKSSRIWRLLRARPLALSLRSGERVSQPDA